MSHQRHQSQGVHGRRQFHGCNVGMTIGASLFGLPNAIHELSLSLFYGSSSNWNAFGAIASCVNETMLNNWSSSRTQAASRNGR